MFLEGAHRLSILYVFHGLFLSNPYSAGFSHILAELVEHGGGDTLVPRFVSTVLQQAVPRAVFDSAQCGQTRAELYLFDVHVLIQS